MDGGTKETRSADEIGVRRRVARRIAFILYDSPATVSPEVIVATTLIWWGAWLANPFWTAFAVSSIFSGLAAIADETAWGSMALALGITHLLLLLIDGSARRLRRRRLVVAGEFVFWMLVSFGYLAQWQSTAMVIYPGMTLMCAWIYLRMAVAVNNE